MAFETRDTIAAISTPIGYGGIGVVRVSGPDAYKIALKIFKAFGKNSLEGDNRFSSSGNLPFLPRKMYYGQVLSPEKDQLLDEALLVYMAAPFSYTTEDVIEIQAHAGAVTMKAILEAVLFCGARLAEPGEFTRRAFTGGRIDLSQAEAVIDVIQAKTETALKLVSRQLEGEVGINARRIKNKILDLYTMVEAEIEFPEEMVGEGGQKNSYADDAAEIEKLLERLLEGYRKGHMLREGMRMILVGRVNVGKSSLMNRFLDKERAIVTEYPGTTRDSIEETLDILGLPVVLIDTAGWRKTKDPVERKGIDRTKKLTEEADLILFMVDAGAGITPEDYDVYDRIQKKERILVVNKKDLIKTKESFGLPPEWTFFDVRHTSVKYDKGIDDLKETLYRFGTEGGGTTESAIVPNIRQKKLFEEALKAIGSARNAMEDGPAELAVIDLQVAMDALDKITGESVKTEVLDAVFSRFCIGK